MLPTSDVGLPVMVVIPFCGNKAPTEYLAADCADAACGLSKCGNVTRK